MFFINKLAIKLIKAYQKEDRPHRCRHIPSCSNYGLECYQKFNFIKASFLTGYRILRCNPLSHKIYDPVPLSKKEKKLKKPYQEQAKTIDADVVNLDIDELLIYIWEKAFKDNNFSKENDELFFNMLERALFLSKKHKIKVLYKPFKKYLLMYIFSNLHLHPSIFIKEFPLNK